MRIAFYTNTYHPTVSGVVQSIHTFRQALSKLGHNIFIFAQEARKYEDTEPFIFRYPAFELPMQQKYPVTIPISPYIDWALPILKPQVIHSHHPVLLGRAAAVKADELGVPLVFTHHTRYKLYSHYVPLDSKMVENVIDTYLDDYMSKCHHIIVPSESIKKILTAEYGITRQITAVPTGLKLEQYAGIDRQAARQARGWGDDIVLISVGRLAKEKNWDTLLKAVAQVMKKYRRARLILIGDGDERSNLEKLTRTLGIADRVEFTGSISHPEVIAHLKAADLFCFASITETQGLVTMEAMAAGLPVVAVDAPGTSDVVEHEHDGLLTENDSNALAQAIEKMLNNAEMRVRFKEASLKRAQSLSIEAMAQRLIGVYHQAIEDRKAGRRVQVQRPGKKKRWYEILDLNF